MCGLFEFSFLVTKLLLALCHSIYHRISFFLSPAIDSIRHIWIANTPAAHAAKEAFHRVNDTTPNAALEVP
jgi:hypothetical protein